MAILSAPPIREQISDQSGKIMPVWVRWFVQFQNIFPIQQDTFIPILTGLTGAANITGNYTRFGRLVFWNILITPTVNTTSVLGTTIITNLPVVSATYGNLIAQNITTRSSLGSGQIDLGTSKAFLPSWSAVADPVFIQGSYQVS